MRGFTLIPFLFALEVLASGYPAGNVTPGLTPKIKKSLLVDRDSGEFVPKHKAKQGLQPGFSPKRSTLFARQSCGDSDFKLCPSKQVCCPVGGTCCSGGDCCEDGYKCCSGGDCCPDTHNCVTIQGVEGCCPIGKTCTLTGSTCADDGYELCPGETFCCQKGDTCYRDAAGDPKCGPGGIISVTTITTSRPSTTRSAVVSSGVTTSAAISSEAPDVTTSDVFAVPTTSRGTVGGGVPTTLSLSTPLSVSRASTTSRSSSATTAVGTANPLGSPNGAYSSTWSPGAVISAVIVVLSGIFALTF